MNRATPACFASLCLLTALSATAPGQTQHQYPKDGAALIRDVTVREILAPRAETDSGTVHTPRAVVQNLGLEDTTFPVTMLIGTEYVEVVQEDLGGGLTDTVGFPVWTASPPGTLDVICYTSLGGDENPANDTAYATVIVRPPGFHDVGVASILAPEAVLTAGDTVQPRIFVRNYGTRIERYFDIRCRVGVGYNEIVTVTSLESMSRI